jgi:hypothetical protein
LRRRKSTTFDYCGPNYCSNYCSPNYCSNYCSPNYCSNYCGDNGSNYFGTLM